MIEETNGGHAYAVDTWAPGPSLGPGRPWDATSDLVVLGQPNGIYRLVELASGRELARLEDPDQVTGAAVFTPDGSKLVVNAKDGLRVWDLRLIRQELGMLRLDWDGPPFPVEKTSHMLTTRPKTAVPTRPDSKVEDGGSKIEVTVVSEGRALAHINSGQWEEAASIYALLVEVDPNYHWYWYHSASLRLQTGATKAYREICQEMLTRFGNTDNPATARCVAKACALTPDAVSDFGPILKLADRGSTSTEHYGEYRWFALSKALAEYRAGHYAAAVDWLNRLSPGVDGVHRDATAFAILAMAKYQMGSVPTADGARLSKEAQAALRHAEDILS
jgi:hypothetical protein